jgi:hypothetical protein
MDDQITSTLRVRIGQEEAHYGGNLVDGARVLKLFGDIVTEIAIVTDGDEGLFVGYDKIEFLAPCTPATSSRPPAASSRPATPAGPSSSRRTRSSQPATTRARPALTSSISPSSSYAQ